VSPRRGSLAKPARLGKNQPAAPAVGRRAEGRGVIATVFDGITRHTSEGLDFRRRAEQLGWKTVVRERDLGLRNTDGTE